MLSAYEKELVLKVSGDDDEDTSASVHSWYTDAAQQEAVRLLRDKFGYSARIAEKALLTGGYTIVTALDPDIQAMVADYYENAEWEKHDNSPIQPYVFVIGNDSITRTEMLVAPLARKPR